MIKKIFFLLKISLIIMAISSYAAENTLSVSATNNAKAGSPKVLQLQIIQDQTSLDVNDIANISILEGSDDNTLKIELTASGAKKLQQFSTQHINQILQISWNGTILNQATLLSVLPGTLIVGGISEEKMQSAVSSFHQLPKS